MTAVRFGVHWKESTAPGWRIGEKLHCACSELDWEQTVCLYFDKTWPLRWFTDLKGIQAECSRRARCICDVLDHERSVLCYVLDRRCSTSVVCLIEDTFHWAGRSGEGALPEWCAGSMTACSLSFLWEMVFHFGGLPDRWERVLSTKSARKYVASDVLDQWHSVLCSAFERYCTASVGWLIDDTERCTRCLREGMLREWCVKSTTLSSLSFIREKVFRFGGALDWWCRKSSAELKVCHIASDVRDLDIAFFALHLREGVLLRWYAWSRVSSDWHSVHEKACCDSDVLNQWYRVLCLTSERWCFASASSRIDDAGWRTWCLRDGTLQVMCCINGSEFFFPHSRECALLRWCAESRMKDFELPVGDKACCVGDVLDWRHLILCPTFERWWTASVVSLIDNARYWVFCFHEGMLRWWCALSMAWSILFYIWEKVYCLGGMLDQGLSTLCFLSEWRHIAVVMCRTEDTIFIAAHSRDGISLRWCTWLRMQCNEWRVNKKAYCMSSVL